MSCAGTTISFRIGVVLLQLMKYKLNTSNLTKAELVGVLVKYCALFIEVQEYSVEESII